MVDLDITAKIIESVKTLNENNFNLLALATNEKSQLQGMISTYDIFKFLINNYKGETDFFSQRFKLFENENNISHCNRNQNLIRANYTDTVYEVLIKLRENRVSMISIERSIINPNTKKTVVETVGLVFLSDIMSLMK